MKTRSIQGEAEGTVGCGVLDVLKSVAKIAGPVAVDLASKYAKERLSGGMAIPINISTAQKRTLKKGGAITIKPSMISDTSKDALAMLSSNAKKVLSALSKNKGIRYALKQGEDVIERMSGKGLFDIAKSVAKVAAPALIDIAAKESKKKLAGSGAFDVLKSVAKVAAPALIDIAAKESKKKLAGSGAFDVFKSVAKIAAPIAIDLASQEAKKRISGGRMKQVKVMKGCGSPYITPPYKQAMKFSGGSIFPSGGSIYPSGKYGSGLDMPIQIGNPYLSINSPAFNPFIPTKSIQSYDKI